MVLLTHLKAGFEKGATVVVRPAANDGMATAAVLNFGANLSPPRPPLYSLITNAGGLFYSR